MTTKHFKISAASVWIASLIVALFAGGCDSLQEKPATPATPRRQ